MALQVPVITSAHGGAIEVVRDGQDGLWVPVGDVDGLAGAMRALARDADRRRAMGRYGRQRVIDCYDRTVIARQVFDVLEIGRASCRERGCLYVWMSVVAVLIKK